MAKKVDDVLELIGDTPLVKINNMNTNPGVDLYAKVEKVNPMGSVKDRTAYYMINEAEEEGLIDEETIIVEATSGNTGLGLAMVCAIKGYHLHLTMSKGVSIERVRMLTALGAEIELTPEEEGTDGAITRAEELSKKEGHWRPDQFNNPVNSKAHYETTAEEILRATEGDLTHFVAGMGTTGTLMGVSKRLKEHDPSIQIIGVEPEPDYSIQGLKNMDEDIVPDIYEPERLDEVRKIEDDDAFEMTRKLALQEGLFVGMSSGAAMHIALEVSDEIQEGMIVCLLPDGGEKYFSTTLFDAEECMRCMKKHGEMIDHPPDNFTEYLEELNELLKNQNL